MRTEQLNVIYNKKDQKVNLRISLLSFDENHRNIAKAKLLTGLDIVDWEIENIIKKWGFENGIEFLKKVARHKKITELNKSNLCHTSLLIPGDISIKSLLRKGGQK